MTISEHNHFDIVDKIAKENDLMIDATNTVDRIENRNADLVDDRRCSFSAI